MEAKADGLRHREIFRAGKSISARSASAPGGWMGGSGTEGSPTALNPGVHEVAAFEIIPRLPG